MQCWRKWEDPHQKLIWSNLGRDPSFHVISYNSLHLALLKSLLSFWTTPRIIDVDSYECMNKICLHKMTTHTRILLNPLIFKENLYPLFWAADTAWVRTVCHQSECSHHYRCSDCFFVWTVLSALFGCNSQQNLTILSANWGKWWEDWGAYLFLPAAQTSDCSWTSFEPFVITAINQPSID